MNSRRTKHIMWEKEGSKMAARVFLFIAGRMRMEFNKRGPF